MTLSAHKKRNRYNYLGALPNDRLVTSSGLGLNNTQIYPYGVGGGRARLADALYVSSFRRGTVSFQIKCM
jgi:hypothetical protein